MKKHLFIIALSLLAFQLQAQTTTFDNLNANTYTNKAITWTSSNYGSGFGHRIINSDPGGQTLLNFQARHNTSTWSDLLTLTTLGRVGIGTTSPSEKLQIENGIVKVRSNNNSNRFIWSRTDNTMAAGLAGDGARKLFLIADNSTRMTVDGNTGNVGIGSTNPSEKLEIEGGTNDTYVKLHVSGGGYKTGLKMIGGSVDIWDLYYNDINNTLNIGEDGIDYLTIKSGGNMGIGTTSPDAKLAVKGNIHTQEVKVNLLGAVMPDYVFTASYNLKTLQEVENYIKTNGHLPNIPSAKDAETNGLLLKDMNLKLLEKIEELTLYTIEQEKRIETLEKENTSLKQQEKRIALLEQQLATLLAKQ